MINARCSSCNGELDTGMNCVKCSNSQPNLIEHYSTFQSLCKTCVQFQHCVYYLAGIRALECPDHTIKE